MVACAVWDDGEVSAAVPGRSRCGLGCDRLGGVSQRGEVVAVAREQDLGVHRCQDEREPGVGGARRGECRGGQRLWRGGGQTVWWFVVAAQTLSAFLQGSWAVSFPLDMKRESSVVEIKDGTWRVPDGPMSEEEGGGSGTWQYAGGTLQIVN